MKRVPSLPAVWIMYYGRLVSRDVYISYRETAEPSQSEIALTNLLIASTIKSDILELNIKSNKQLAHVLLYTGDTTCETL